MTTASDPPERDRPPQGGKALAASGFLDSINPFMTAPLDGSEGVTVLRRWGQGQRDSQPPDLGSALWATAPLAGNVSFGDCSAGDIAASEAEAWRLLRTMEGARQAERDDDSWNKTWSSYALPWLKRAESKPFLTKEPHQQKGLLQYHWHCQFQLLQYLLRRCHPCQHLQPQANRSLCPRPGPQCLQ
uniref:Uncharacterized protein n=1 Tax=Sphaerodactylus townsendi TaxID=933632 RepID=A0ACB8FU04_9SAUR